jgi:hypothetical protein
MMGSFLGMNWFAGDKKLTGILCTFDRLICACAAGAGKHGDEMKIPYISMVMQ